MQRQIFGIIKKKVDRKFSKSLVKNFRIWLLSIKRNISQNIFFPNKKEMILPTIVQKRKINFFLKRKIFPIARNCENRFVVWTAKDYPLLTILYNLIVTIKISVTSDQQNVNIARLSSWLGRERWQNVHIIFIKFQFV